MYYKVNSITTARLKFLWATDEKSPLGCWAVSIPYPCAAARVRTVRTGHEVFSPHQVFVWVHKAPEDFAVFSCESIELTLQHRMTRNFILV